MKISSIPTLAAILLLGSLAHAVPVSLGDSYLINGGTLNQAGTGADVGAFTGAANSGFLYNLGQSVDLANTGDYIEMSFTVVSFVTNNNNPWAFRMGIYDIGGTAATADSQTSVTDNWDGYLAWYKTTSTNTNQTNNAVF